jgi:hypothetical protein
MPTTLSARARGLLLAALVSFTPTFVQAAPARPAPGPDVAGWVTTVRPTTLWSGPDGGAVAFGPVPTGRPLRAERVIGERVFVQDPGDGLGRGGGPAWVDWAAVAPEPRPRHWFGPADPARGVELWSGPDEQALFFGVAGPERPLARAGEPVGERLLVLVADDAPGLAWAPIAALAPMPPPDGSSVERAASMLPPQFPPPAPAVAAPVPGPVVAGPALAGPAMQSPVSAAEREAFVAAWGDRARRLRPSTGLPPSLAVAMAINETGWGRSRLAREAHNFFGLKAGKRPGTAGVLTVETWEVVNGEEVRVEQTFRAFHTPEESLLDLARHLRETPRYAAVWTQSHDPDAFARAMLAAGYATDPAWADKLARLRMNYHLDRFDH